MWFITRQGKETFLFLEASELSVGLTQPPFHCGTGALSQAKGG
jgi:hypothetical protein